MTQTQMKMVEVQAQTMSMVPRLLGWETQPCRTVVVFVSFISDTPTGDAQSNKPFLKKPVHGIPLLYKAGYNQKSYYVLLVEAVKC